MNERLDEDEEGLMEVLDSGSLLLGVERDEGLMERFLCLGSTDFSPTDQTSISKSSSSKRKIKKEDSCEGLGSNKKQRKGVFSSVATIKVRKDKLGDRISMLQQLVSPFGKSDTASVLLEALGYIRFLHDQVQVLSSPYLQRQPIAAHIQDNKGEGSRRLGDLRSRGLCLVPITCTEEVANNNGADYWSSAMGSNINLNH